MTLKLGSTDITGVYVGATPATAVYLGATKIWPTGPPGPVDAYKAAVLADSPDLYVRLDEATPADESVHAQTITNLFGPPTFTTDPTFGAVVNGGSAGWWASALLNPAAYTLETVAFRLATGSDGSPVGAWSNRGAMLFWPSSGLIAINDAYTQYRITVGGYTAAWHHVAQTFDGTTLTLFVDGVSVGSKPAAAPVSPSPNADDSPVPWSIRIAHYQGHPHSFAGNIHSVSSYSTALSPSRIAAHNAALPAH